MKATALILVELDVAEGVPPEAAAEALAPWADTVERTLLTRGLRALGVRVHVFPGDAAALAEALAAHTQ